MSQWRVILSRLHAAMKRARRDREFDEEMRQHQALLIEDQQARGVPFGRLDGWRC